MAKLIPLAPDSAGFKVLSRLYDLNGTAFVAQLAQVLWAEFRTAKRFEQVVTVPLTMRGLVTLGKRNVLHITAEGRLTIESYRRSMPTPRVAHLHGRPLDVAKHCRFEETRPGALEYRDKPSIMGGARVPYCSPAGGKKS